MTSSDTKPLWQPSAERIKAANLTRFIQACGQKDYAGLYAWSVAEPVKFWQKIWEFCGVIGDMGAPPYLKDADKMPGAQFFPGARLNLAENLLRRRDDKDAIVFWGEDKVKRRLSFRELHDQVSQCAQALKAVGVKEGDRVAGYVPNMPEAVIAMLATTSLGAVWSSASPDFGVKGVLDRFGQIEPKVLFAAEGYYYNGKGFDCLEKVEEILRELPSVVRTVIIPYTRDTKGRTLPVRAFGWAEFLEPHKPGEIAYNRVPFNHPAYVMFSSGTTGAPKCIVHGVGGTVLQHLKELRLHSDVKDDDRVFYFTTCGWMMWNWVVSCLGCNATLLQYDGSPFHPSGNMLFDYADAENMTLFGTSAKWIDAVAKAGLEPIKTHKLASVRAMTSTGSPLAPENFAFVYDKIKKDICLSSISGGTDILSCFALGNPILPVWAGELQCRGLGLAVDVFDDDAKPVRGDKGELVCTKPFPCMPIYFWNDPDGKKYHAAYFERFDNIWCHGDYVELTAHDGMVIHGRSDSVLNPGGVRIGTAEIYRQVEQAPEVVESLVIGQDWQ
ncbi:MAG: acetoacetate--CoA ligase, partial [Proteobacteria bacterium]|nr:acetoacetate--CoA ligase [Pseudomonadota bacterium]